MTKLVSIVIPTFNQYPLLHQLLMDIKQHCQGVSEVLVVNDSSTERDIYKGLEFWKKLNIIPLRVINIEENVGFLKASNKGIKAAKGDIVILISTDVRIYSRNFYDEILHSVNPKTLVGTKLYTEATGWNQFGDYVQPYLEGWCLAANAGVWQLLNYFDERYAPSDFEDVCLSRTAMEEGLDLIQIPEGSTMHMGGKSIGYNSEREAHTIENRKKFADKWGLPL